MFNFLHTNNTENADILKIYTLIIELFSSEVYKTS